jgi:rhodanese-related sulfurtransferase
MTPRQLAERLDAGERLAVLDVRRPEERAFCAIAVPPSALDVYVEMDEIPERLEEVRAASRHGPLVVYCHHGVRSRMVAVWLEGNGITGVSNLDGGIEAWSRDVDPKVPRY